MRPIAEKIASNVVSEDAVVPQIAREDSLNASNSGASSFGSQSALLN
jgi:hypothetical protein